MVHTHVSKCKIVPEIDFPKSLKVLYYLVYPMNKTKLKK